MKTDDQVRLPKKKIRSLFGRNNVPSERAIRDLQQKFVRYPCRGRSDETIARIRDSVQEEPNTSIRHRSQQLNLSYGTTQRILKKTCN